MSGDVPSIGDATQWLRDLRRDLASDPYYRYGDAFYDRVAWEIGRLSPELIALVRQVIAEWLEADDPDDASFTLAVVSDMHWRDLAPNVRRLYEKVRAGRSAAFRPIMANSILGTLQGLDG